MHNVKAGENSPEVEEVRYTMGKPPEVYAISQDTIAFGQPIALPFPALIWRTLLNFRPKARLQRTFTTLNRAGMRTIEPPITSELIKLIPTELAKMADFIYLYHVNTSMKGVGRAGGVSRTPRLSYA
jgi:hypothetical protein